MEGKLGYVKEDKDKEKLLSEMADSTHPAPPGDSAGKRTLDLERGLGLAPGGDVGCRLNNTNGRKGETWARTER